MKDQWFPVEKFKKYLRDPLYMLALIVAVIGTYGYYLTHETIVSDSLANDLYVFRGWNKVSRFTQSFLNTALNWNHQSFFLTGFLSVVLLGLSAILFCIIFERFLPDLSTGIKVLFSCLLVSAPIYTECYEVFRGLSKRRILRKLLTLPAVFCACQLVLLQISDSSYWYYWNFRRYNEEREVIRQVGYRINSEFDYEKPVAFTGIYQYSDTIRDRVYFSVHSKTYPLAVWAARQFGVTTIYDTVKDGEYFSLIPQTTVQSCIHWSIYGLGSDHMMVDLFGFEGFKFTGTTAEQQAEAGKVAAEMPRWPARDSIRDMGDYLVVHF